MNALTTIRDIGSVEALHAAAERGIAPAQRPQVNSHVHLPPNFSAFETVGQVVDLAQQQGVGVLGVSNYYDYRVYDDFAARTADAGIFPLYGLEIIALIDRLVRQGVLINDPGNPGKIYICGKGITRFIEQTPRTRELLDTIRRNDASRMAVMAARIATIFAAHGVDTGVDARDVIDMVVNRHDVPRETVTLQERHVAQRFQEALFAQVPEGERTARLTEIFAKAPKSAPTDAVGLQGEIRSHLMKAGKPAFVEESFLTFEQAHELIRQLGGIPCYPTLADGTSPICPFETPVEALIENILSLNVHMAELIPIRNTPEVLDQYVTAMRRAGLAVVAGTEHNTLDLIPIAPTCKGGAPIPERVQEIFWEGACVTAAHQFLTAHGQEGFVLADGSPNRNYPTGDERIRAFARLGAAVIQEYFEKHA